jgi:hypothetical protein
VLALRLLDPAGGELAHNTDWFYNAPNPPGDEHGPLYPVALYAPLRHLDPKIPLGAKGKGRHRDGEWQVDLTLTNSSPVFAFQVRLQFLDRDGGRLTPFFATDNYLTVAPGQSRKIALATRAREGADRPRVVISGWNLDPSPVEARVSWD